MSVHWVFDDVDRLLTMTSCPHTKHGPGLELTAGRFPIANLFHYWRNNFWNRSDVVWQYSGIGDRPRSYAYCIGTWQNAEYWTGWEGNAQGFDCFLDHVPAEVMADAKDGRALLVIDNLNEGFYEPRLYQYLHACTAQYDLPPKTLCFVSGNELNPRGYAQWCDGNGIRDRITIIGFPHLWYMQQINLRHIKDITWEDHAVFKQRPHQVKLFNCLNRVSRQHRELLVMKLIDSDLHIQGLISCNQLWYHCWDQLGVPDDVLEKTRQLLPLVVDDADFDNNKAMHINPEIYKKTWMSVITETHAFDEDHNLFISEKLWKPIWALQPFMVWGHRGTMTQLRSWGFQTYDCLWDETYDDCKDLDRVAGILQNLQQINVIKDKNGWLNQCREICEYNKNHFMSADWFSTTYHTRFMQAYAGVSAA
jgi:hypothetical protein